MLIHPEMLWELAKQHQRTLISAAEQERLLAAVRRTSPRRRHE